MQKEKKGINSVQLSLNKIKTQVGMVIHKGDGEKKCCFVNSNCKLHLHERYLLLLHLVLDNLLKFGMHLILKT